MEHNTNNLEHILSRTFRYSLGFDCKEEEITIPTNWACDAMKDCADGSDEKNCTNGIWRVIYSNMI